ncbi:replication initiation and membrane attachment family protein [Ornithinibacillus bavariensis]|uniref:replication initiation and membrane attachment family protein n=1 Tax=Ornithinibacillus bavariensis TaxID=545502 RepID=UPI003D2311A0
MNYIGKILPVDGYMVDLHGNLPVDYSKSLTHLYLPLIGIKAVMLYQTLLHEMEFKEIAPIQTHHTIMNYLNISLVDIYEARLRLEGIGLLKTFENKTPEQTVYYYVLQSPFSPNDFFKDAMLSQLLFHHVGQDKYSMLKSHYVGHFEQPSGQNVTASFHEVFDTIIPDANAYHKVERIPENQGPHIDSIDFSWMEHMLKSRMIPYRRVLTTENKRIITQMMHLYGLAEYEVEKCVLWALTDENYLDIDEFKEACHDTFKNARKEASVQLVTRETEPAPTKRQQPITKEEQFILELERISPKQLLEDLSSGNHASEQDLKVIREIMTTQGLPSPVMNVLIHYVLLQTNMKLSKAYLETIASHWSRANLKTAKEAMEFAKREKERYRQSIEKKQNQRTYRKQSSKEVVPDWFKERKQKTTTIQTDTISEVELQEMESILNKYSSGGKNSHLQG